MSAPTSAPSAPFQQWQNFYPAQGPTYPYSGYDMPTTVHEQIYASVTGTAERTKQQAANDIARDILRAVDTNGSNNAHLTEINAAQITSAVERNGNLNMSTTERINAQLASAVERNGSMNQSAIERTTGEARLTTVITDAASRQAANDSARDILGAVERTGFTAVSNVKDAHNGLLGAIERNAGENRMTTVTVGGQQDSKLTDVRHAIIQEVNRATNELLGANRAQFEGVATQVQNGAWENRNAIGAGFAASMLESSKYAASAAAASSDHYASLLLEQQKLGHFMSAKADGHFASGQLELQKVKEGLACQSATQFAAAQLDAHKNREAIQKDLAEARYEALKSQQYLTDKIGECCCSIKEKMDVIDRDRLRDNLIVSREDNNVLKILEFGALGGYGRGYGDRDGRGHGRR